MTLEQFKNAKELREEIQNIEDLEILLENAFEDKNHLLAAQRGNETINSIKTYQIPEKLRGQILDLISDFRCDLENDFEDL